MAAAGAYIVGLRAALWHSQTRIAVTSTRATSRNKRIGWYEDGDELAVKLISPPQ